MEDDGLKVTFRIPESDLDELGKLVPSRFLNISDAVRAAVRMLVQSCKQGRKNNAEEPQNPG